MLGLGLSIPQVAVRGSRSLVAAIRSLFAANEPGVWYDPSDLSTLFQDSAGTTPVTAVEQPVGLMLDKSKGLVLGPELVTNGTFDTNIDGWTTQSTATATWSANGIQVSRNGANFVSQAGSNVSLVAGKTYKISLSITVAPSAGNASLGIFAANRTTERTTPGIISTATPGNYSFVFTATVTENAWVICGIASTGTGTVTFDNISVRELPGNHASQPTATSRPVLSARVNQYLATETLATQSVTTLAAQYRLNFEGTGTVTLSGTATGAYSAGSHLITCTAGTLTSTVSGSVTKADLRVANTGAGLPAYQRVNTATDYDTVGFPHYLRFDGVDDWLVTPTITPGIDKAQVFAGVRKLSDAATNTLVELSSSLASNTGAIAVFTPVSASATYTFASKGSSQSVATSATLHPSPITSVFSGIGDISADQATLRINGTQAASNTADQGTGNYLAYPLYIGRRGGTTLSFNGHLYSLIVRFGANLPAATIENTEKYINQKTRAY